jgi:formiminoglutamase
MLLEEGFLNPARFYEMAYQPFAVAAAHLRYLADKGATAYSLHSLRERGLLAVFRHILEENSLSDDGAEAVFWGIDLDSVNAAEAPGVSAPNALGLTGDELCQIAALAGKERRSRIFEITEVNPTYDIDGRTSRLAAVALWHFLNARVSL